MKGTDAPYVQAVNGHPNETLRALVHQQIRWSGNHHPKGPIYRHSCLLGPLQDWDSPASQSAA